MINSLIDDNRKNMDNDEKKIIEVLTRGVDTIMPSPEALKERTVSGKKMRIYCGYDPTGPSLHLGHLFTILKLADFQALGHHVIMLIGDFTGMIGDPTDKAEARKKLTREDVLSNSANYKKIAGKFIDFSGPNPAEMLYNSEWGDKLSFADVIETASNFTVQQMMARDMFQERIKRKKPIFLHEFLYPLAQGYDSVAMDVDLEIGGRDQLFNMLCGRDLMKAISDKEKFVLGTKLLVDPSGKKMGKTEGAMVALDDEPGAIYGKIMSWADELIIPGMEGCTRIPMEKVNRMEKEMKDGSLNPSKAKAFLAKEITSMCHGPEKAESAEREFNNIFQKGGLPSKMTEVEMDEGDLDILDLLVDSGLVPSKNEGRRIIGQKGVKVNGKFKTDWKEVISVKKGMVISVGKRKFVKIV